MRRLAPLALALVLVVPTSAHSYTFLSGNLPATLTLAQSPYVALSVLSLYQGACTVEAGVVVYFTTDIGIEVWAPSQFLVNGTEDENVSFLGYQGASWRGLWAVDQYGAGVTVHLDHCNISNAGQALRCDGHLFDVAVRHCDIDVTGHIGGVNVRDTEGGNSSSIVCEDSRVIGPAAAGFEIGGTSGDVISIARCRVQQGPGIGFALYGTASAQDIIAVDLGTGLFAADNATVIRGTFSQNTWGIQVDNTSSQAMPLLQDLVIESNQRGVYASTPAHFVGCSIFGNQEFDVYCVAPVMQYATLDMRGCYWGPTTTQEMIAEGTFSDISTIYDWWDNHGYSLVDYSGFLGPVAVAQPTWQTWGKTKAAFR